MQVKTSLPILFAVMALVACSSVPTATLEGTRGQKVGVQFEEFAVGTACTVETPKGSVTAPSIPGAIKYSVVHNKSPITCTTPDGIIYDVNVAELLPKTHGTAGITAYQTGLLIATTTISGNLIRLRNDTGVTKRSNSE